MLPYASLQEAENVLGRSLTRVETLWFNYTANKSDYFICCYNIPIIFLLSILPPLCYLVMELLFPSYVAFYKLQPKVEFSLYDKFKCYSGVMRTFFLVVVPTILSSYPWMKMIGIRTSLPLPSSMEVISHLIIYLVIDDYTNYWLHRFCHSKWMYENFHRVHHEYTAPMGFATLHAHWMEILVFGIPSFLAPALVPGHMLTLFLWLVFREIESVENHCGYVRRYDFPWALKKFIPFSAGSEFHDYHHYVGGQTQSNFAPFFTYCDYIYGTDKGFRYRKRLLLKKQLKDGSKKDGSYATFVSDIKSE